MADLPLFHAVRVGIFMFILSNQRAVAQPTASETTSAKPPELWVTTNGSEESVTSTPMETDTRATIEFDTLVPSSLPGVTPEGASIPTTDPDMTTAQTTRDPDTIPTNDTTDIYLITTEATTETSIMRSDASTSVCTCDVTPGLCDIGCCCDTIDCGTNDLGSVFAGCEVKQSSGVCIENWLMFRGNVDPTLITVNDTFFCVRNGEDQLKDLQTFPDVSPLPRTQNPFSFAQQDSTRPSTTSTAFYRVDDSILTNLKSSSLLSVLRQPSPGTASTSCVDRNPARFLHSVSLSCSRSVTALSCLEDPSVNARSYANGISLLKAPVPQNVSIPNFMIPVLPLSEWPEPILQNDSCLNVVSKVEFTVGYTSGGELTKATVNVTLVTTRLNTVLLQDHAVRYLLASPSPTPGPSRAIGLPSEAPVIGRFGGNILPLTVQGPSQGGQCSSLPDARRPVLLTHNYFTGCSFSSLSDNCYELQSQLFGILQGAASPEVVAMNSGSQPNWTRVIVQNCSRTPSDSCESGCLVPLSLSVQLLWARQGLLSLPQNQILGAKFIFRCQNVKCPLTSPLTVTTEVTFSDTTGYPESPRGKPEPQWKFPFGFFSRGAEEQDAGLVTNHCEHEGAAWGILCFLTFLLSVIL
ncbi:tectonic-3-like isoform X1 [Anguilla anguilla]|uniref:tectonic-3-like isoform X1 n=1 Tax=Anguilla anguilla TaxID=7936 RepID=UPI0015AEF7F4|nr:tectonic-3-like isoform X1 [Anguilla anguilla]